LGAVAANGCSCWPLLPAPVECESLPGDEDAVAPDDVDLGFVRLSGASRSWSGGAVGATADEIGAGDDDSFSSCEVICARCAVAQPGPGSRWLLIICEQKPIAP